MRHANNGATGRLPAMANAMRRFGLKTVADKHGDSILADFELEALIGLSTSYNTIIADSVRDIICNKNEEMTPVRLGRGKEISNIKLPYAATLVEHRDDGFLMACMLTDLPASAAIPIWKKKKVKVPRGAELAVAVTAIAMRDSDLMPFVLGEILIPTTSDGVPFEEGSIFNLGAEESVMTLTMRAVRPALLAISLLHSRGVALSDGMTLTEQRRRLRRKSKRKGRAPAEPVKYKVLDIGVSQPKESQKGGTSDGQGGKALHKCMGHFRTYTEKAKLFGKYVGTFWTPAHERGSAKNGVVIKDYKIK